MTLAKGAYLHFEQQRRQNGGLIEIYMDNQKISAEQLLTDASAIDN